MSLSIQLPDNLQKTCYAVLPAFKTCATRPDFYYSLHTLFR